MKISEYQTNRHAEAVRLANTKTAIATAIEGKAALGCSSVLPMFIVQDIFSVYFML